MQDIILYIIAHKMDLVKIIFGIIAVAEVVVRLTPTEKDNNILRVVQSWIDRIFPNKRKGGGLFRAFKKRKDAPPIAYVKDSEDEE